MTGKLAIMTPEGVAFAGLLLLMLVTGCTTSRIDVARHDAAELAADTGFVLLARQHNGGQDTEESFMECLTKILSREELPVSLYPEQDFVDNLFPWFEARTAPTSPEALPALLQRPGVSQKIAELGVRYLVWVEGNSEQVDGGGGMSCAAGPGGGGCLGFVWWDTASIYEAMIWDLRTARSVGAVSADATGMSYVPALIVPVPLIARTQTAACKGIAEQLKAFFNGGEAALLTPLTVPADVVSDGENPGAGLSGALANTGSTTCRRGHGTPGVLHPSSV